MPPIDRMDPEAYPWPHAYPLYTYNLRRSYVSFFSAAAAVNFATHSLFNGSSGDRVIVVRSICYSGTTAASPTRVGAVNGPLGAALGSVTPIWRGEANPAGAHFYQDAAAPLPNQQLITPTTANNLISTFAPFAVLPPGWSFYLQGNAAAQTLQCSFTWEELSVSDPRLGLIGPQS